MKQVLTEELIYEVLSVVEEIPAGTVATYGHVDLKKYLWKNS